MHEKIKEYLEQKTYNLKTSAVSLALYGAAALALTGCGYEAQIMTQQELVGIQQEELGNLQKKQGIQQELIEQQKELDKQQEELGKQQEELGKKQEELGKQQEELGKQQEELGKQQEELGKIQEELGNSETIYVLHTTKGYIDIHFTGTSEEATNLLNYEIGEIQFEKNEKEKPTDLEKL